MGHLEIRIVETEFVEHKEIEVEGPRPPALVSNPARRRLDPLERGEEVVGGEGRLDQPHRVQIWILVGPSHGSGFVKRGNVDQGPQAAEPVEPALKKREPISEVRAETDGRPDRLASHDPCGR